MTTNGPMLLVWLTADLWGSVLNTTALICCSHLPDDHCSITGPQLTATGIWQKEGQKATDSKDPESSTAPEASLETLSPQHHPFNSRTLKHQLSFIYHKSASTWQPQCSLPLRAGLSPSKGSYCFAQPPRFRAKLWGKSGAWGSLGS